MDASLNLPMVVFSFAVTMLLVFGLKRPAKRLGWGDRPPRPRKQHTESVPLIGGLAMSLAFLAALVLLGGPFMGYRSLLVVMIFLALFGGVDAWCGLASRNRRRSK